MIRKSVSSVAASSLWGPMVMALFLLLGSMQLSAQQERKEIRQGVRSYEAGDYGNAEVRFRKAHELESSSFEADFNTGAALYGQEKYEESLNHYQQLLEQREGTEALQETPEHLASVWHNMGNSLLEAQQYAESIEAYKNSLRLNPSDQDSKYNLAYARQKLQEQQEQQQDQQQNQDQQQQDQNQDQQNQDQNQDQQQQDQQQDQQEQQQDQDQQEQEQNQDQQQQEQEAQPMTISKEDAERMLQAIQEQEKDVKEKVDKQKAAKAKVKSEKDW